MIKSLLLPTMETMPADRASAAGESLAAELSDRLLMPRPSISRVTGEMEKHSPLFCGSSANPQPSLFHPPADHPPAPADRTSSVDTWRFYQQSKGEAEAAAAVLNCAAAHSYHHVLVPGYDDINHPDALAARLLSGLRDEVIKAMPAASPAPPAEAPLAWPVPPVVDARRVEYSGPWPRNKHTHRCLRCGEGMNCYKQRCTQSQRVNGCRWCR